jgi:membrane protein implicated in regulation of membrane protease activity
MQFLVGISPWWWVAFALALGAIEMATMSFFLIWPALAALCLGALVAISPDMSGNAQIVTFATLGIIFTFSGRFLMSRYGDGADRTPTLNQRGNHFVGRSGKVLEFGSGQGVVEVEGMRWRANWPEGQTAEVGAKVRIVKADGMTLFVESIQP